MKKIMPLAIVVTLLLPTLALALIYVPAKVQPSGVTIVVPDIARDRAPPLVEPGTLQKTIFIHYVGKGPPAGNGEKATCYKLLRVKWKSLPVSYIVHPDVENTVPNAIYLSAETWDVATTPELFNDAYTVDTSADWDNDYPDGRNEYSLGDYSQEGVIAVTVVWSGVPIGGKGRQIIEYDVMFDTDFPWGDATVNSTVMDLQNIATHETGHGVGLDDVYDSTCSEVTMYGYSDYGEIKKRTLEQPDITGLQKLYK